MVGLEEIFYFKVYIYCVSESELRGDYACETLARFDPAAVFGVLGTGMCDTSKSPLWLGESRTWLLYWV